MTISDKIYVVTGGAGFIGSVLAERLETIGVKNIVICDFLRDGEKWKNIAHRTAIHDYIHPDELIDWLNNHKGQVETIFHMGASSSTTVHDVDFLLKNNYHYSKNLWHWCCENKVSFIYASSAATYGDGAHGFCAGNDIGDYKKLRPLNPYGWSKQIFDLYALKQAMLGKTPPQWAGLKFFNVYGPNEFHKGAQSSVIPQFVRQIQETGKARLFKSTDKNIQDGEQLRDFVWVFDCVNIMLWLQENNHVSGIYNAGSGTATSFNDLTKAIFKAMNLPCHIDYIDMPVGLGAHYQNYTKADMSDWKKTGYTHIPTPMEQAVRQYVCDFILAENNDRYL